MNTTKIRMDQLVNQDSQRRPCCEPNPQKYKSSCGPEITSLGHRLWAHKDGGKSISGTGDGTELQRFNEERRNRTPNAIKYAIEQHAAKLNEYVPFCQLYSPR